MKIFRDRFFFVCFRRKICYNRSMKRTKSSTKKKTNKEVKNVNNTFFEKTVRDDFGNKNTVILQWGDGKGEFLKQEIKNGN